MARPTRALTDLGGFRRKLILLTGAGAAVVAAALALVAQLVLAASTSHNVNQVLEGRSDAVIGLIDAATPGAEPRVPDRGVDPGVVVYDARGRAIAGSEPPSLRADFIALSRTTRQVTKEIGAYKLAAEPFHTRSGARGSVVVVEPLAPYEHQESQALVVSLASGVLIVLLTVAVAAWISRRALAPVADMARTAEDWSEHDLERRFDLGPPTDEIRALAHTLDGLLDKVGHAIRTEQRLTSELAHELRTPLTSIQGTADLIGMRHDLDDALRTDVEEIGRSTRAMAATITLLLDVARRHPEDQAANASCPVDEVIAEVVRRHPTAQVSPDNGEVLAVPLTVAMGALTPVLENAVRIAGAVRVSVEAAPDHVDLVVTDEGPGVSDPGVLFRPGAVPGRSGLGLSLARRIARSAGGDVLFIGHASGDHASADHASGDDEARGAAFVVRLPRA